MTLGAPARPPRGISGRIASACRLLPASLALLLWACASASPPPQEKPAAHARPALWKLADQDTTIFLFGTIHLLPQGAQWRTTRLDDALGRSDTLVLEVAGADPAQLSQVLVRLGRAKDMPPLAERVPPEKRALLAEMIEKSGFPAAAFDRMETWAAALTLASSSFARMGFSPELGVEKQLTPIGVGKQLIGLETVEQQLGYFDQLSEEAQRMLLVGVLTGPAESRSAFQQMMKAWLDGDVDAIARTFDSETTLSPELREVLMRRRNGRWAAWIAERMARPGTVFMAVGAGHLAGADSVQAMLNSRGLRPRRVQ